MVIPRLIVRTTSLSHDPLDLRAQCRRRALEDLHSVVVVPLLVRRRRVYLALPLRVRIRLRVMVSGSSGRRRRIRVLCEGGAARFLLLVPAEEEEDDDELEEHDEDDNYYDDGAVAVARRVVVAAGRGPAFVQEGGRGCGRRGGDEVWDGEGGHCLWFGVYWR
ncbi:hypothetical protein EJ04DRAFT_53347 [Polyplosphaeria fusca]|uniref:Uncharacterized protein n=1 Tax=Polyplosphaeria fusca TaxID=682080 RepID=A0A9P4V6G4_9PLEO|nr:hypothetical protein EJ04DRAFT_53347 [Polyplosphaeria fusca]